MDRLKELKKNFRALVAANPNLPIDAVVTAVDKDTCSVVLPSGLEVEDVRLNSVADGETYIVVIPRIGSEVLLLSSDGTVDNFSVIKVNRASRVLYKDEGLEVELDGESQKVQIKNDSTSLKDLFQDLSTLLKNFKVFTPSGPSGTPLPTIITSLNNFEIKFKSLLK